MKKIVLINGIKHSKLSAFNRLTQFGDGLFETCVVKESKLLFWSEHFARLERGRTQLKINEVSEKQWIKDISKALNLVDFKHAVVKIILSRGESERGYGFKKNIKPTRIVIVSPMPKETTNDYTLGVCASGYASNPLLSNIKHCNRLEQILARVEMHEDECLMLDDTGCVISVTQGNIFGVKSGELLTPELDKSGIEGTRRMRVLKIAKALGLKVNIGQLTLKDLYNCDEIFVTNSVLGVRSVSHIDKKVFSQKAVTKQLEDALKAESIKEENIQVLKPKKHFIKKILSVVIIFSALAISHWANTITAEKPLLYHLPQGTGINATAINLEKQGVIHSRYFLIAMAKILDFDTKIKSGYYDIDANMSVFDLLKNFVSAKVATRNITLIEGKTIAHYYQQLTHIKALKSSDSLKETMRLAGINPPYEGYFWPDTYQVNVGDSVASVFKRANQKLQKNLQAEWQNRDKTLRFNNASQALVLASLIEKETAHTAEKTQIAGVFMRRLQLEMRLQTDPTVVYALNLEKKYRGFLTRKDLKFKSPYNTYRNKGLPPTAIASVSASSLYAAMHPAKGESLYFVSKKDGSHAFAKTYKQHRLNIKKYLK
ncbi:MAG: Endolytic murein transglycosylase [Catillopecten margaritatus gill symbiont]|uniref:Endolytic murein transglycosylase n=1 Tax=Catillopecten margaritatus gill symbiont TaxID=3083288 RepID=A0AAU6PEQ0_9GAMM